MSNEPLPSKSKAEKLAQSSFVLAAGSIACGITAIPAIVQSIRALACIKKSNAGRGAWIKAIGSLIFSSCALGFFVFCFVAPLRAAQAMADEINCCNHIKDLALEMRSYEMDNGDRFPSVTKWCDALVESVTNQPTPRSLSFLCPSAPKRQTCGYAINVKLKGVKDTSRIPKDTVVLFESDAGWNGFGGPTNAVARHYAQRLWIAFADGSVKDVKWAELEKLRWYAPTNDTRNEAVRRTFE